MEGVPHGEQDRGCAPPTAEKRTDIPPCSHGQSEPHEFVAGGREIICIPGLRQARPDVYGFLLCLALAAALGFLAASSGNTLDQIFCLVGMVASVLTALAILYWGPE